MSLIAPQPKAPEKEQLTIRLERPTHELLKRYCTFIQSTQDYVLNQVLLFAFQADKDFNAWLASNPDSPTTPAPTRKKGGKREYAPRTTE